MSILLVNATPPFLETMDMKADCPPLNLLYVAQFIDRLGMNVTILDGNNYPTSKKFLRALSRQSKKASVIGFTLMSGMERDVYPVMAKIHRKFPGKTIIIGGWLPTLKGARVLKECEADIAFLGVNGEVFASLERFVDMYKTGKLFHKDNAFSQLENIGNIVFRNGNDIVETPKFNNPQSLESLDFRIGKYNLSWLCYRYPQFKIKVLETMSGINVTYTSKAIKELKKEVDSIHISLFSPLTCPWYLHKRGCTFCDMADLIHSLSTEDIEAIRFGNMKRLEDEIASLGQLLSWHPLTIEYNADATTYPVWKSIVKFIKKSNIEVRKIVFETRADMITGKWLEHANRENIKSIFQIGFEFGNQKELDFTNKGIKIENSKKLLEEIKSLKIESISFFILSTKIGDSNTIRKNIEFIEEAIDSGCKPLVNPYLIPKYTDKPYIYEKEIFQGKTVRIPLAKPFSLNRTELNKLKKFLERKIKEHEEKIRCQNEKNRKKALGFYNLCNAEKSLLKLIDMQIKGKNIAS